MRAPDGSYEDGFVLPGENVSPALNTAARNPDWARNNPLSLDEQVRAVQPAQAAHRTVYSCRTHGETGSPP